MNTPSRKNVYSKSITTTRTNCEICSRLVRTAIGNIRISHRIWEFEHVFSNWAKFDVMQIYLQIKYLYISYFVLVL